ncbi:monooxygenase, partial [Escherichia coli]|nr:monooxygenase [Escherichia coli]
MATLLQLHFAFNGPFGDAMAEQLKPLAESINQEPGFLWKVWTESEKNHEAGGIYLFTDEKSALAGNDSNLLIVFYVQIMPDDFVMQLHR